MSKDIPYSKIPGPDAETEKRIMKHRQIKYLGMWIDTLLVLATYSLITETFHMMTGLGGELSLWRPEHYSRPSLSPWPSIIFARLVLGLIKPFFFHTFGTTPAGAILGIRIFKDNGEFLTLKEGWERYFSFFSYSYQTLRDNVFLKNSFGSVHYQDTLDLKSGGKITYTIAENQRYRVILGFIVGFACIGIIYVSILFQDIPPNRGDLTLAEYIENYNYIESREYLYPWVEYLDEDGNWIDPETGERAYRAWGEDLPEIEFEIENGYVVGVSYERKIEGHNEYVESGTRRIRSVSFALLAAQKEVSFMDKLFFNTNKEIRGDKDFQITNKNITMTNTVDYKGFQRDEEKGSFSAKGNEKEYLFSQKFSVKKK